MTTLFICEKPSMAQAVSAALSTNPVLKKGYIDGQNGLLFTWAVGHLLTLAPPEFYDEKYKNWRIEDLPIIPQSFNLVPIKENKSQLSVIQSLSKNAELIVNSGDSGREGQTIFEYISIYLKLSNKPTKRLWTSSLTAEAIQRAYKNMKDNIEYQPLFYAGYARAQSDWLIGLNGSRIFSLKGNNRLNIGRVQTPTLAMIYDSCEEHFNFVKTKYYPVKASFQQGEVHYTGIWEGERIVDSSKAQILAGKVQNQPGVINEFEKKTDKKYAPSMYSLSLLQKEANGKYPLSAKEILAIAQSLYEKHKCITYPRTSSSYVTKDDIPFMHQSLKALQNSKYEKEANGAEPSLVHVGNKRICNDAKVDDHHAIMPTHQIPSGLTKNEELIYDMIVKRFLAQFYPPATYDKYVVRTTVTGQTFKTNVSLLISPGWKSIYQNEKDEQEEEIVQKPLLLDPNQKVLCTEAEVLEKETTPLPLYTDGTIIDAMKKAGNKIDDSELKEAIKGSGIGTEATRATILEKLKSTEYIAYKGKSILITDKGKFIIETIRKTNIQSLCSVELTAEWEKRLGLIEKGQYSPKNFMDKIKQFTHSIIKEASTIESTYQKKTVSIGDCPTCKTGKIIEGQKAFGCNRWREGCGFKIWKKQFNKTISDKQAQLLLTKGQTGVLQFTSKEKKTKYKAKLILTDKFDIKLEFVNDKK